MRILWGRQAPSGIIAFLMLFYCTTAQNDSNDTFTATNEWQVVPKGQAIPKGLHVRLNLETNVVEAKLLDPNEENDSVENKKEKSLTVVSDTVENNTQDNASNTVKEPIIKLTDAMEDALKKLPSRNIEPSSDNRFRSLDELKAEFENVNVKAKSDFEILNELFQRYEKLAKRIPNLDFTKEKFGADKSTSIALEMLDIFIDLEYLVHQYDNANEFIRLKGLENIIYPHLNGTENTLKAEVLKILSACLQNNIKVQIYALESNLAEKLLKIISLENNEYVKAKAIRALGSLVRGFPTAQKHVTSKHGMDVLLNILHSDNPNFFLLKVLIITLLDDLILEHKLVTEFQSSKSENEEKIQLYREVDLMNKLSNPVFCNILSRLLIEYYEYDHTDLENIHKITTAMTTFIHSCKNHHYRDKKILATFHKMHLAFNVLSWKKKQLKIENFDDSYEFYTQILEFIEHYSEILRDLKLKDEL